MKDIYYCFHCYGRNEHPSGRCVHCGDEISAPADITYDERLIWSLRHPDPDRAMVAARTLGARGTKGAVPALRQAVLDPPDPYVAAKALQSLVQIEGIEAERSMLEDLVGGDSFIVALAARNALANGDEGTG